MEDQMKGSKFGTHKKGIARIGEILLALLVCAVAVCTASAQVKNSTITGTVTDQSGAVVPRAVLTVTNQLTNETVKTQSGPAGDYALPYLAAGRYAMTVDAPGFQTYRINDIVVGTGATVQVSAKLAVGSTTQVVQVAAATAELQTQNSSVTGAVEEQQIQNLPNINNNPLYYATLTPGVVPAPVMYNSHAIGVGYQDRQQFSAIRVDGGEIGSGDVLLDGVPVQGSGWHAASVIPNRDALQEVTVSTNDLTADLGGGQAVTQMITKSGTNDFHGDLYYNLRNEQLNANTFSNNQLGLQRAKYRVDEAGGSIGGPVTLPKLFNGKDRVFFFVAFDRTWMTLPFSGLATVPTDLQRQGDYSQTLIKDQNGNPVPATIYNPFSVTNLGGGVYQRALYPTGTSNCPAQGCGSIVTNPDPYGLKYLQAFPEPNHAPDDAFGDDNYYYNGSGPTTRNDLNSRVDFHFGRNSFYLSGGVQNGTAIGTNAWGSSSPWQWLNNNNNTDDNPYGAIGDTIALNPTTFIDLHVGFQRVAATSTYPETGKFTTSDYTAYGMPASVQSMILLPGTAPSVYSLGYGAAYSQALNNGNWVWKNEHQDNYDFNGSITKVIGRWTLKGGADERIYLSNWKDLEWNTPSLGSYTTECYCEQYSYANGSADGSLDTTAQQNGTSLAMAPVGVMGWRLDAGSSPIPALADKLFAVYTQDDWKATNKLTVNLGLRYEIQPGPTERHNREYGVDLSAASPFAITAPGASAGYALSPLAGMGALEFSGVNGYSRHMWDTEFNDFAPRVGAAYRLTDRTALRGGFGRIYAQSNTGYNANGMVYGGGAWSGGTEMTPYGTNFNGSPGGVGDTGNGRFEDPADTTIIVAPGPVQSPSLYGDVNGNASVDYFMRKGFHNAYVDQWNFFVERQVNGWLASVGYVGSRGSSLPWRTYPLTGTWAIPQQTLMNWRSTWIASNGTNDPSQAQVANPMPALIGLATGSSGNSTITAEQASEGYLDMLGQTVIASKGSSLYNSLQLTLKHSYSSGLTAQFSYDWSHATGIEGGATGSSYAEDQQGTLAPAGGINYTDLQSNKGILGFDVPQRFVGVVTYLDQWGSGQKYALGNPVARALAGGWQLGTVVNVQTGQPWGPSCNTGQNQGALNQDCLPTGQPLELPKTLQHWYDGNTSVMLPDGRWVTPSVHQFLKWNPDAFKNAIAQFPNGNYSIDQYWNGTTPMYDTNLRMPVFQNVNLNVTRQFAVRERYKFELLAEATNLFNHPNYLPSAVDNSFSGPFLDPTKGPVGDNGDNNAGSLSGSSMMDPRQITMTLRFTF